MSYARYNFTVSVDVGNAPVSFLTEIHPTYVGNNTGVVPYRYNTNVMFKVVGTRRVPTSTLH